MLRVTDGERKSCSEIEIVEVNPQFIAKGKWKEKGN